MGNKKIILFLIFIIIVIINSNIILGYNVDLVIANVEYSQKGEDWGKIDKISFKIFNQMDSKFEIDGKILIQVYDYNDPADIINYIQEEIGPIHYDILPHSAKEESYDVSISLNEIDLEKTMRFELVEYPSNNYITSTLYDLDPLTQKTQTQNTQSSTSNNCNDLNLILKSFCFDSNDKSYVFTLQNLGSYGIKNLYFIENFKDMPQRGTRTFRSPKEFTSFSNGESVTIRYIGACDTVTDGEGNLLYPCPIVIDENFESFHIKADNCEDKKLLIKEIKECGTGKILYSSTQASSIQDSTSDNQNDTQSSSSKSTLSSVFGTAEVAFIGLVIGLIILIILSLMIIRYIKNRPKTAKPREEIQEQEEISKIPKSISEAISIRDLTVKHGSSLILDNIDLDVKKGELVCLLGPSGTGKSTIIESLVGRKYPTRGSIKIFNEDISNKQIFYYVGFVPQHAELYMNQTVEQNLLSSATKWGIKDVKNKVDSILSITGLSQRKDLKANHLSGGQLKLLSLGMELIRDPELLILDEPTTGLDPNTRDNIVTILSRIVSKQNKTVFFTTHFMEDAEGCDEVIIIAKAKIVAQGPPSKLEKRLPGHGKIANIILDNITDDLVSKIGKIYGVKKIISEGRNLKIIMDEPNAVKLGQKIDELGGVVNKTEITSATMKEVFVYFTGERLEE